VKTVLYFCDESHIRRSNHFGVGGIAIETDSIEEIESRIGGIRDSCGFAGRATEIQWKSACPRKDDISKMFVDLLFDLIAEQKVFLHLRFTEVSGASPSHIEISKAHYQLLLHRAGRYFGQNHLIAVRPDNGCCTDYLPKMTGGLNSQIRSKYGAKHRAVVDISPQDSRNCHPLQLLDVTLGALTAARNLNHLNGVLGSYKARLASYALSKFGLSEIKTNSNLSENRFNIWIVKK
jgi:hypothetical protein